MLDLDPIKATLSAATPGPWGPAHVLDQGMIAGWPDRLVEIGRYDVRMTGGRSRVDADAHLIASAPSMMAALVIEVERQRNEIAGLVGAFQSQQRDLNDMRDERDRYANPDNWYTDDEYGPCLRQPG